MAVFLKILLTCEIGLATGMLSGAFGLGGGFLSTPALRLVLQTSAGIALGTTLPVIFPTALVGGLNYLKAGLVDRQTVRVAGPMGMAGSICGAYATKYIKTDWLMVATGALIALLAARAVTQVLRSRGKPGEPAGSPASHQVAKLLLIGLLAGLLAGLLGVGGGVILIPGFMTLLNMDVKRAFGTSLFCITLMAVPGSLVHYFLGHVDVVLFLLLSAGVIPGSYLGSRFTIKAQERLVMLLFSLFLLAVGIIFIFMELRILL